MASMPPVQTSAGVFDVGPESTYAPITWPNAPQQDLWAESAQRRPAYDRAGIRARALPCLIDGLRNVAAADAADAAIEAASALDQELQRGEPSLPWVWPKQAIPTDRMRLVGPHTRWPNCEGGLNARRAFGHNRHDGAKATLKAPLWRHATALLALVSTVVTCGPRERPEECPLDMPTPRSA